MLQLFGLDLALGSLLGLWLTPLRLIGRGFWWLMLGIAAVGLAPSLLPGAAGPRAAAFLALALLALALALSFAEAAWRFAVPAAGAAAAALLWLRVDASPLKAWIGVPDALLAALLVGGANFAMLFGHWYLVIHGLKLDPFRRAARLLIGFTAARVALLALGLAVYWNARPEGRLMPLHVYLLSGPGQLFFAQRVLYGILATVPLAVMASKCADLRNTQSATGILYALELAVLVGEGLSRHLTVVTGLPL